MIKEQVEQLEAGEGVEQAADDGSISAFYKALNVGIGCKGRHAVLQGQQYRQEMNIPRGREQGIQPEEGTSKKIEGIGADEVRPQVGVPVPAEAAAFYCFSRQMVERHLLGVEVAVVDKIAVFSSHDGNKNDKQGQKSQNKRKEIAGSPAGADIESGRELLHSR